MEKTIYITIPFKRIWEKTEKGYKGSLGLCHESCIASIKEEGKVVGSVKATMGASIEIGIDGDKSLELRADASDIWDAYCDAINRKDLKF